MRILNGANWASECRIALPGSITQGNWMEITTRYQASSGVLDLRVGDSYASTKCTVKQQNRAFTHTFIGKSSWANDLFFHGSIAGFFVVDAYLHTTQMQAAMLAMQTIQDILVQATCKACPNNTESAVGSASVADCECISGSLGVRGLACMIGCDAGSSAVQDGITGDFTCVACDFGKFKSVFGTTACVDYDAGKFRNSTGAIDHSVSRATPCSIQPQQPLHAKCVLSMPDRGPMSSHALVTTDMWDMELTLYASRVPLGFTGITAEPTIFFAV